MKKVFLSLIIGVVIFNSCTNIAFVNSEPKNSEIINEFPKHILGAYFDEDTDTLEIYKNRLKYGTKDKTLFALDEKLEKGKIELKKLNNYYILNIKDKSDWLVLPFIIKENSMIVYQLDIDLLKEKMKKTENEVIKEINNITKVEVIKNKDNKNTYYLIDPTNAEFEKILEMGFFIKLGKFTKINKK